MPTEKCWIIYNDFLANEAHDVHHFDADYMKTEERIILYTRTDLLVEMGCLYEQKVAQAGLDESAAGGAAVQSNGGDNGGVASTEDCGSPSGFERKGGISEEV